MLAAAFGFFAADADGAAANTARDALVALCGVADATTMEARGILRGRERKPCVIVSMLLPSAAVMVNVHLPDDASIAPRV